MALARSVICFDQQCRAPVTVTELQGALQLCHLFAASDGKCPNIICWRNAESERLDDSVRGTRIESVDHILHRSTIAEFLHKVRLNLFRFPGFLALLGCIERVHRPLNNDAPNAY